MANFYQTFDRVVVINLAARPQRLARFWESLADWPFQTPRRFDAIDGHSVPIPPQWDKGPGAWGCQLSHQTVLETAIVDGISSILVLEDDACPVADFAARAGEFLSALPSDWDGLMFGAEHLLPAHPVSPGLVRCALANRTHAYALRRPMMVELCRRWRQNQIDHCDIILASLMPRYKVYAPHPFLMGQAGGPSDITGRDEPSRFFSHNPRQWPRRPRQVECGSIPVREKITLEMFHNCQ